MAAINVLCVDDEAAIRRELAEGLRSAGFVIHQADSGRAALSILNRQPDISVILTDVRMANGDGLSMAASVLADRTGQDAVEVVVLTGHANVDMVVEAVRIKVFEFLRKPVRLRDVIAAVRRAHDRAMERRSAVATGARFRETLRRLADLAPILNGPGPAGTPLMPPLHRAVINDALRNPLVPITGFAELIETGGRSKPQEAIVAYARQIRLASAHLATLVSGITALISVCTANDALAPRALDAETLTRAIRGVNARNLDDELCMMQVRVAPSLSVHADEDRLRMVLELLASDLLRLPGEPQAGLVIDLAPSAAGIRLSMTAPHRHLGNAACLTVLATEADGTLRHRSMGLGTWLAMHLAGSLGASLRFDTTADDAPIASLTWPHMTPNRD